ncbi:hypothetical protein DM01DRAFT_1370425 [Hesseltinella vesiculosa]|uniref:Uncharacterized protein n=1 Tax=Hesseltinella vesiculosa TaxID=101127 RepID=A0A1X2GTT0_9FUNG|nr:hypothetical protein DM01DRAFT_1370425 [Hesseltinella vesiculosa]
MNAQAESLSHATWHHSKQSNKWMCGQLDVDKSFYSYQQHCMNHASDYIHVDANFIQLLCISSIFVLQKRTTYASIPVSYFNASQLASVRQQVVEEDRLNRKFGAGLTLKILECLKSHHLRQHLFLAYASLWSVVVIWSAHSRQVSNEVPFTAHVLADVNKSTLLLHFEAHLLSPFSP